MPSLRSHFRKSPAFLQELLPPTCQLIAAVCEDGSGPFLCLLAFFGRPASILDPIGYIFDQPTIPERSKHLRQVAMAIRTLLLPQAIVRYCLRLFFIQFCESLDRDVEIA